MNNDNKKLRALIICSWIAILLTWMICFITGEKLNIVVHNEKLIELGNFIDSIVYLRSLLSLISYYIVMSLIIYTILREKYLSYKPIIISAYIIFVWSLKYIFINYLIANYLDFTYIIFIVIIRKEKWLNAIIEFIKVFIFSFVCTYIKTYNNIYLADLPSLIGIIMMIDYYIMAFINYLYIRKEDKKDAYLGSILWKSKNLENYKRCFRNFISRCHRNYRSFIGSLKTDGWRIYCAIIFSIITYGSILIVSFFHNKMIEVTISIICFHIFRKYDVKTFHATTAIKCFVVSLITFSVLNSITISLQKSIISAIIMSYLLTKIMYYIQDYIDYIKEKKIVKDLRPLENLTFDELKEIYSEYSDNDLKAIYECLHKDRSVNYENIAMRYNMSRMTLYRIMKKVRNHYFDK